MQLQEDAIAEGYTTPMRRLLLLALVTYFSAAFSPSVETVMTLFKKDYPHTETGAPYLPLGSFFDGSVFPLLEGLGKNTSLVYIPILVSCLVCSAMDKSDPWRINLLAGYSTFFCYTIHDFDSSCGILLPSAVLAIAVLPLLWKLFGGGIRSIP